MYHHHHNHQHHHHHHHHHHYHYNYCNCNCNYYYYYYYYYYFAHHTAPGIKSSSYTHSILLGRLILNLKFGSCVIVLWYIYSTLIHVINLENLILSYLILVFVLARLWRRVIDALLSRGPHSIVWVMFLIIFLLSIPSFNDIFPVRMERPPGIDIFSRVVDESYHECIIEKRIYNSSNVHYLSH